MTATIFIIGTNALMQKTRLPIQFALVSSERLNARGDRCG